MSEGATLLLCEKCGAGYDLSKGGRTVRCSYCGTYATLPINLTSQWTEIFNRGNAYRKNNDFEKAVSLYEDYLKNNPTDAEAHWQCALARFGIEYVQDPDTKDFIPTFRMLSFDSFLEDYDYLSSVSYSEGEAKIYYQKEAQRIAELMGRQIAVARNERPYDIFISYKETDDETEERTPDSIRAQELYEMLVQKGYRVFFARISLEEKAGAEFEPYIFAALNSAKVMLVVGSDRKNFEATWVKNEWQRFNALRKKDLSGRLLIPCIFNMSAKDLPNSLKGLQAIDLGIPGSNQQVVLSVSKCVNLSRNNQYVTGQGGIQQQSYRPTMQPVVQQPPVQIRPVAPKPPVKKYTAEEMIEMAKADLARGCFRESRGKCDAVLKDHPQNENALFTAFLASNGMPKEEMLKKRFDKKVEKSPYYQKLMECASEELKGRLLQYKQTYKTQKRVKTIIGLVVCGIIIAAATVVVFRVRNKIYLQLINHYITDSKELTNDIVDYYKEDADAKLSQYVPSDQSGEAYQIITGNPEYLGYCLATNSDDTSDNTNAVYYLYCYDAEWEITRDEILASDKVYKEKQKVYCYVVFKNIGIKNNGEVGTDFRSKTKDITDAAINGYKENVTGDMVEINNVEGYLYSLQNISYRGYDSYEEMKNVIDSSFEKVKYYVDEGKVTSCKAQNKINLLYRKPSGSSDATLLTDLCVTYDDGEYYPNVFYFNDITGAGSMYVDYAVPDGFSGLTFTYTGYPGWFYPDSVITVQVLDADTQEVIYTGENVKYEESVTAVMDITGHKNIRIVFDDVNYACVSAVAKDVYVTEVFEDKLNDAEDVEGEETPEAEE